MIAVSTSSRAFEKDMKNIVNYSIGFLDGVQGGKKEFLQGLGKTTIEAIKTFIDTNAKVNPELLQHVYEWDMAGSPSARLFDIDYTVSGLGLSLKSTFRQSTMVQRGSNVPFYNKATIMENGIPVVIKPKSAKALVFNDGGEEVFTKGQVKVDNPGGSLAQGGFQKTFDNFFKYYFTQAFLRSSGIAQYLEKPKIYKSNFPKGKRGGRSVGYSTGYRWIANAGLVG